MNDTQPEAREHTLLGGWGCWIAALVMLAVVAALFYPVYSRARAKASSSNCLSNVKQIMLAHLMYAADYDGRFPYAPDWPPRLYRYLKNEQIYVCPADARPRPYPGRPLGLSYTMNVAANELQTDSHGTGPGELGVIFDGTATYGLTDAAVFRKHEERKYRMSCNVGYADGHAKAVLRPRDFTNETLLPPWSTPVPLRPQKDLPPLPVGPLPQH
ncbi:MAG TPA: hypothetical protein VGM19_08085 [Armatimonadota bacterium]|jgi:prepilin-type processing-associated H-X9-DG protein